MNNYAKDIFQLVENNTILLNDKLDEVARTTTSTQEQLEEVLREFQQLKKEAGSSQQPSGNGMSICMSAGGSRGDVQPLAALGVGLQKLGFHVIFAAGEEARCFAEEHGFEYLRAHSSKAINQSNKEWMQAVSTLDEQKLMQQMAMVTAQTTQQDTQVVWDRIKEDSAVCCLITSTMGAPLSFALSYARKIPAICLYFMPFVPTSAHLPCHMDSCKSPGKDIPPEAWAATSKGLMQAYYQNLWLMAFHISWSMVVDSSISIEDFGKKVFPEEELHQIVVNQHHRCKMFYAISPQLLGGVPEDYPRSTGLDGYLFFPAKADAGTVAGGKVSAFIAETRQGFPEMSLACVGFGSMCMADKVTILRTVLSVVRRARCRVIILTGWAELDPAALTNEEDADLLDYASEHACFAEEVDHDWLMPRCDFSVHHGGAGTTAAALRSGRPMIVMPFGFDQGFMGDCVTKMGCGLRLPSMITVTTEEFYDAVVKVTKCSIYRTAAEEAAAKIASENGVAEVCGKVTATILGFDAQAACKLAGGAPSLAVCTAPSC